MEFDHDLHVMSKVSCSRYFAPQFQLKVSIKPEGNIKSLQSKCC